MVGAFLFHEFGNTPSHFLDHLERFQRPCQFPAGIFLLTLISRFLLPSLWKEHSGFDKKQCGCHGKETAPKLQVEFTGCIEVVQVLAGNALNRYIMDINSILRNQMEKQIHRSLKNRDIHLIFRIDRISHPVRTSHFSSRLIIRIRYYTRKRTSAPQQLFILYNKPLDRRHHGK